MDEPAPNQLTGVETWAYFNPDQHEVIYSLRYNPQVGEPFRAEIRDGIAQDFIPKKVYNKTSGQKRVLQSWEDQIDPETETESKNIESTFRSRSNEYYYNRVSKIPRLNGDLC